MADVTDIQRDDKRHVQVDLDASVLKQIADAIDGGDAGVLKEIFSELHPADIADHMEQLSYDERVEVVDLVPEIFSGDVLSELEDDAREDILPELDPVKLAEAVNDLESDDATDLLEEMDEPLQEQVLAALPAEDRRALETSLSFDEETAGRLMQREFVAAPTFWTVGHAIDHMRDTGEDLPEVFFNVYVVDPGFKPQGYIPVSRLMRTRRDVPLADITEELKVIISPEQDQEDVAYLFEKYHLISAPVTDAHGRLSGTITIDDMVEVISDENKEDMLALAGVNDAGLTDTAMRAVRSRAPWLFINLVTAILASAVIAMFEGAIEKVVALAVLMPIVASMGGNTGTQTLAVAVRAIAERDLTQANARRVIWRETVASLINGLMFAALLAVVTVVWFQDFRLAGVIALAMVINSVCAGLSGILVPLGLKKVGADPAVASSVFVTTVTDVVGFLAFLGLASWILL